MRNGQASRTAEHNALFRALESARAEDQRLFDDPFARQFLSRPLRLVAALSRMGPVHQAVCRYIDTRWPGVRTSVVARTKLIDDALAAAISESGTDHEMQLVILGAGYDTRASRLSCTGVATVFEVDHPDTQRAKQRTLRRAGADSASKVRYVATDFNQLQLESRLADAGYRATLPAVLLWEGVTNYLSEPAVDAMLRWCADAAPGSVLIFTYVHRDVLTNPDGFFGADRLHATLAKVDERLTFGIDPDELPTYLADRGLSLERDIGASEYRRLVLGPEADQIRGHEFYRMAVARVGRVAAEI